MSQAYFAGRGRRGRDLGRAHIRKLVQDKLPLWNVYRWHNDHDRWYYAGTIRAIDELAAEAKALVQFPGNVKVELRTECHCGQPAVAVTVDRQNVCRDHLPK